MKNVCPTCEFENRPENVYCTQCGSKLQKFTPLSPRLVLLAGKNSTTVFAINGERVILGRDPESTIVIGDDQVSKNHACIYFEKSKYWIKDLDSKNGVYLNGAKISGPEYLVAGSLIKLGSTLLRFESQQ
jgi:pSer/pThr/pTyr-binding forkhead associated (FHA) protein